MDIWGQVSDRFGLAGRVTPLVGERTANALMTGPGGESIAVLKLHDSGDHDAIVLEIAALHRLSAVSGLTGRVPRVITTPEGEAVVEVDTPDGMRLARALTWLPGRTWRIEDATPDRLAGLGRLVAAIDRALAGFDHPAAGRFLRWNLVEASASLDLLDHVADPDRHEVARAALATFSSELAPRLAELPAQVIHQDANPANVVLDGEGAVHALIDFGDLSRAPRVCGLAVALAYAIAAVRAAHAGTNQRLDPLAAALPLVVGYHEVWPLSPQELALLVPLARTRLAVSVVMAAWQRVGDPDNHYLLASQDMVWPALQRLSAVNDHLALCRVRRAVGLEPCPRSRAVRDDLTGRASQVGVADVLGRPLIELGYQIMDWSGPELPPPPQVTGEQVLVGRYLEDRAVYAGDAYVTPAGERRTVHLAVDLFLPAGHVLHAPLDGVVELFGDNAAPLDYGPVIVLRHRTAGGEPFFTLYGHLSRTSLVGLTLGRTVRAGEAFAAIGTPAENGGWAPHVHLQILTDLVGMGLDVPGVAPRSEVAVWASLCPDPNLLLGLPEPARCSGAEGRSA